MLLGIVKEMPRCTCNGHVLQEAQVGVKGAAMLPEGLALQPLHHANGNNELYPHNKSFQNEKCDNARDLVPWHILFWIAGPVFVMHLVHRANPTVANMQSSQHAAKHRVMHAPP